MSLTGISNTKLASVTWFTPSYISRIRSGSRTFPKDPAFLDAVVSYLESHIQTQEQEQDVCRMMQIPYFPVGSHVRRDLIKHWILDGNASSYLAIPGAASSAYTDQTQSDLLHAQAVSDTEVFHTYYGEEGKRTAILRLIRQATDSGKKQIIYSSEDTPDIGWINASSRYQSAYIRALNAFFAAGNRFMLAIDRRISMETSLQWINLCLPFIARGYITLYYYPKQRDNLFHMCLVVAPESGAVLYTGLQDQMENMPLLYITDPKAVHSYADGMRKLFDMCIQSLYFCNRENSSAFWRYCLTVSHYTDTTLYCYWNGPSALTIPHSVLRSFEKRFKIQINPIFHRFQESVEKHLQRFPIYEYCYLPTLDEVERCGLSCPFDELLNCPEIYYTRQEYASHLRYLLYLLEKYENYHLYLFNSCAFPCDAFFTDKGSMVLLNYSAPHTACVETEGIHSYNIMSYYSRWSDDRRHESREETIAALKNLLGQIPPSASSS